MRLWSVVAIHAVKPWRRQSARAEGSARAATCLEVLRVGVEGVDLLVRPGAADGRHRAHALADERLELVAVGEGRVAGERRADERLVQPVAGEADACELLLAERRRLEPAVEERDVLGAWHDA